MEKQKLMCPFSRIYCEKYECALWHKHDKHPGCALLNLTNIMDNIRFHIQRIDEEGIGVYHDD